MAESVVSSVLRSVGNLAVQETKFLCGVTLEVAFLKDELMRLQAYLKDADSKWRSGNARVAVLVTQIKTTAYEAQNVIEAADYMEKRNMLKQGFMGTISRYARLPNDLITFHKVGVEIQRVRRKLSEIFASAENLKIDMDNTVISEHEFSQEYGLMKDDVVMVGFEDEHEEIVDTLVDNEKMLTAVSIVAMGGAGKTTLAKKVYTSSRVKHHFEVVAWVTVSQTFKGIDLLKDIMKQITGNTYDSVNQMEEYDLGKKISDFLLQKRYLLVLDDVPRGGFFFAVEVTEVFTPYHSVACHDTWEQLNRRVKSFPDAANGSRVMLTTRKEDVANHLEMSTHVHALKHLDEEKSWELFRRKALPPYKRSALHVLDEFEELGRKLAKKCDGLPLALTVLGGYLSRNLNRQSWSDVLLGWPSTKNVFMMRNILARSYTDLPSNYLRSCLLYLPTFPEDRLIDVSVLIALWIAEGFIPHAPKCEPEETARKYLAELAERNLVQVTRRSEAHGWIEEIRVHDILHDWCIEEARQDGFLCQGGAPLIDIMTSYRFSYEGFSGPNLQEIPNLRALLGFQLQPISHAKLRFLRVLHIENSVLGNFSNAIGGCIHLRYLGLINCGDVSLPSSVGQLIYLQTIDMRGTIVRVRSYVWDIPSLRHVYLDGKLYPPRDVQQKVLQTLWLVLRFETSSKYYNRDMVRFLGEMTQLRAKSSRPRIHSTRIGRRLLYSFEGFTGPVRLALTTLMLEIHQQWPTEIMNIFAKMPCLVDICLHANSTVFDKFPESHHFPKSLRSFNLHAAAINQDPMPELEKIPSLVVLRLKGYSGRTMSCSARGFPRLRYLDLFRFTDTKEWNIEAGAMPKLSHMELTDFPEMSKLPKGLLHLPCLDDLILESMPLICFGDCRIKELRQKGCKYQEGDARP
ncbi:hypothetical protein ACQ4PT_052933 [Festuca glaucescens]